MFIYLHDNRGQSTLEYGVVIAIVVAALLTMQFYVKRGLQGKMRESTDQIGEQFSPLHAGSDYTTHTRTHSTETVEGATEDADGADALPTTDSTMQQIHTRTGSETVNALNEEGWRE